MPRTASRLENTPSAPRRRILSTEHIEMLPSSSNLSFLDGFDSVDQSISCDNHFHGDPCGNRTTCLRHQTQTFHVNFAITTQGGPMICPANFFDVWKNIAKISREAPTNCCCPIIKGFRLTKEKLISEKLENEKCSICMEKFKTSDIVHKTLCGHCFHKNCLSEYLKLESKQSLIYKCPLCRKYLTFEHIQKQFFNIRSNYKVKDDDVICDQAVFDNTYRLYNRRRRRRRRRSREQNSS